MLTLRLPVFLPAGLLALLCVACGPDAEVGAPEEERGAPARAEGARVIVVAPPENAASMSDEAYADWAAYLNDFAAEHPELRFERIVREALDEALADPPQLSEEYAAIFVRSDGRAAFYDGMILEPFVYDEGADFVAGRVSIPEYLELRE